MAKTLARSVTLRSLDFLIGSNWPFRETQTPLKSFNEVGYCVDAVFLDSFRALVRFFCGTKADPLVETALLLLSLSRAGFGCPGNNQSLENAGEKSRDHPGRGKGGNLFLK